MANYKPVYETALDHIDTSLLHNPEGAFHLEILREHAYIILRVQPDDKKATKALQNLKLTLPKHLSMTGSLRSALLMWLSPDEYLLIVRKKSKDAWIEKLEHALKKTFSAVVDSSGTYSLLQLSGNKLTSVLSKLINYDLKFNFAKGKVISTHADAAPVILFKKDADTIYLMVRFSYSAFLYEALAQSAKEFI